MKWWRRLIFSIISLVLGYISLDYLYSAFTKLTNASGSAAAYSPKGDGLSQLLGAVMFLKKILLVEDNETIIMGLKYSLEQENFQVISAKNVAESKEKMV